MTMKPDFSLMDLLKAERMSRELFDGALLTDLLPIQVDALLIRLVAAGLRPWPVAYLRSLPYREGYLLSGWWRARRQVAIMRAGQRCQGCDADYYSDVHHLSYENLGDERDEDLLVLCRACHEAEHRKDPRPRRQPKENEDGM